MVIDPEVWPDFDTCKWQTDAKIEISASNHRRRHQNSKNDMWRYRRSFTLDDLSVPRKGHDIIISVQTMDITLRRAHPRWRAQHPIDVHITSKKKQQQQKRQVRKLQALKHHGTQISLTWPWKQVTSQTKVMAGTILRFSGKMQIFKD